MDRLRRRLRRVVAKPLDRWRRRRQPLLSVVVQARGEAELLGETLRSIRRQHHRRVEVMVVDDPAPDDAVAMARRRAVASATGSYLMFLDAGDTLTRGGVRSAIDGLEQTGSDLAVLPTTPSRPARRATLAERPDVMAAVVTGVTIVRRASWDTGALDPAEADQLLAVRACRGARGIDVPGAVACARRQETSGLPPAPAAAGALRAWFDEVDAVLGLLADLPDVRAERALHYLRHDIPATARGLERADDDVLQVLLDRVPAIVQVAPRDRYAAEVPAEHRVLAALLAAGDRGAVRRFVRAGGLHPEMHPVGLEPAGLTVHLPGWQVDPVPPEAYVLTAAQTAAQAVVRGTHHDGPDLVLDVVAWFPHLDLVDPTLVVKTDGDIAVVVRWGDDYQVALPGAPRRYAGSGWVVTLKGAARRAPGAVTLTLEDGGRTGTVTARIPR